MQAGWVSLFNTDEVLPMDTTISHIFVRSCSISKGKGRRTSKASRAASVFDDKDPLLGAWV